MKLKLEVQCDNAAFGDAFEAELARILRVAADRIAQGADRGNLRDVNGNTVGAFKLTGSRPAEKKGRVGPC
jgi:hypothetical protein